MTATVDYSTGSPGMKHRRVVVPRRGDPDVLQVGGEDLPEPGAGEARIKILAAGVSAYDLMVRRSSSFPGFPRVPFTPGADMVGMVDQLGAGVSTIGPGQVVAGSALGGLLCRVHLPARQRVGTCPFGPGSRRSRLPGGKLSHRAHGIAPDR